MPRARKPGTYSNRQDLVASGRPQAVRAPSGQTYGERQGLESAQQAQPLPGDPIAALMSATGTHDGTPTALLGPTQRPDEPVTAGLTTGPGPGPEVLFGPSTKPSETFELLARETGDDTMFRLAERARRLGR